MAVFVDCTKQEARRKADQFNKDQGWEVSGGGRRRWRRRRPGSLQILVKLGVPSALPSQHPLCAHLSTCCEAVRAQGVL